MLLSPKPIVAGGEGGAGCGLPGVLLSGQVIELIINYVTGHVRLTGRVRRVGGGDCVPVIWVGEPRFAADDLVEEVAAGSYRYSVPVAA